jgi:hypothetical protein
MIRSSTLAICDQTQRRRHCLVWVVAAMFVSAFALPQLAIAASGTFTYVAGTVYVETNGQRRVAQRGTEVNPGDRIITEEDGMAQLAMVDQAKLSLRSSSQLIVERYQRTPAGQEGAVLNLIKGTLRSFTGLLTASNRDKYAMKTRVATVGIRGSGNILQHDNDVTLNHTIEGVHVVQDINGRFAPVITRPNDTIKIETNKPPEKIPTPPGLVASGSQMTTKAATTSTGSSGGSGSNDPPSGGTGGTGPNDPPSGGSGSGTGGTGSGSGSGSGSGGSGSGTGGSGLPSNLPNTLPASNPITNPTNPTIGTNIVPPVVITVDPSGLRDIVMAGGGTTYSGQAAPSGVSLEGANLRGFTSVGGGAGTSASVNGGNAAESQTFDIGNNSSITIGRWSNPASVNFAGFGSYSGAAATTHFAYGGSGYPAYLSDVLTGTVSYSRIGATTPTNNTGATGTLDSATLSVNFTQRLLNATLGVSMAGTPSAPVYSLQATNVPFSQNSFFTLTGFGLTITRTAGGQTSAANAGLSGTIEGSFVGATLSGIILGYAFSDNNAATRQSVSGVVAFQGPAQITGAPFLYGLISDPTGSLVASPYSQTYATINRPDEVTGDNTGRLSAFRGPFARGDGTINGNNAYAVGSAQVLDSGTDTTAGLSWGRWSGGTATVGGASLTLNNRSLHYIFSASQTGATTLPLTGTGVYEVAGSTRPTDLGGNVGTMNTATLNANFSARTVDASLNVTVANQTWNASATGMAIYRDMTFGANTGRSPGGGLPAPTQLNITCTPNCGATSGSLDGFFSGRTGQGAGVQYSINSSVTGAIAFRRRGG